jgi:hypothetical protein
LVARKGGYSPPGRVGVASPEEAQMSDQGLSADELAAESASALPNREAMSSIKHGGGLDAAIDNFAMPINEAIAVNNESVSSVAIADADQIIILNQTDVD